jgi:hypothetical protein
MQVSWLQGKDYMFWDSNHLTAKGHALALRVFPAAQSPSLRAQACHLVD